MISETPGRLRPLKPILLKSKQSSVGCSTRPTQISFMPLYEYQCKKCGHKFERIQRFSDPLVKKCPECGGKVEQVLSAPAVQFKGSGWYVTDYAKKGSSGSKGESKSNSDGKSDSGKKETKTKTESTSKSAEKK